MCVAVERVPAPALQIFKEVASVIRRVDCLSELGHGESDVVVPLEPRDLCICSREVDPHPTIHSFNWGTRESEGRSKLVGADQQEHRLVMFDELGDKTDH